ncbi:baseplate hub and tail lysozyme [Synechococcus phage S-H9-1]|uniref:Putative baseplate lysozyme n=1 Tax=Synechococcus phage S-H9-1 TaxID=2783674 RepID=A0A873WDQ3_9CAUD|nr:baseplate hub and tail lysozyme [Synechococcus phage S-H9-1]QPB08108.1 putative baseplate lysozyme [Synechococcus phage S-H9-1]
MSHELKYNEYSTSVDNKAPSKLPTSIASPTTPDEEQTIANGLKLKNLLGPMYDSHIYTRFFPSGDIDAMKIRGPGGTGIAFTSKGQLKFHSGKRTKANGPGSGNIAFHSDGAMLNVADRGYVIDCGKREPFDNNAFMLNAFGDSKVEVLGTHMVRADKIILDASNIEIRGTNIQLVCGDDGAGSLDISAGQVNELVTNKSETVFGQKRTIQIGEESIVQLDVRGSSNNITSGADQVKSVGDQRRQTAGIVSDEVGGAAGQLVKDRTNSFALKILLGNATISTVVGNLTLEATAGTLNAVALAGAANMTAGGAATVSAAGALNLIGVGTTTIKGALINLN